MKRILAVIIATALMTLGVLADSRTSPAKLFVAKITYSDGPLEYPCVVFADSIVEATSSIVDATNTMSVVEILVSEWPVAQASFFELDANVRDKVVRVNRGMTWSFALRPTWPLDPTSSGDAVVATPSSEDAAKLTDFRHGLVVQGYLMDPGPDVRPGESGQETHERRQLEDLKSLPNGGRASGHSGGGG
jgi:hypothetical protein